MKLKKIIFTYFIIITLLFHFESEGKSVNISLMSLNLHIEPIFGKEIDADKMPFKLDDDAIIMFTPGIIVLMDLRDSFTSKGWSLIFNSHANLSCYGNMMGGIGLGGRYKFLFSEKFTFDITFILELMIMTRHFLPTHELHKTPFIKSIAPLAKSLMNDLQNKTHKIFPAPLLDFSFSYILNDNSKINFAIIWSGVVVGISTGISFKIDKLIKKLFKNKSKKYRPRYKKIKTFKNKIQ